MANQKPTRFKHLVRDHLGRAKGSLFVAGFCTLTLALTELARPWPLKIIFDQILLDKPLPAQLPFLGALIEGDKLPALVVISLAIVAIALLKGVFSYFQVYITSRIGNQMVYAIRRELFAHIQRLSLSFHSRASSGELLTKVANDTSTLKDIFAESALAFGSHLLIVVGTFAIMFALNWQLGLIVLITFPILIGNLLYLYRRGTASAKRQRKKEEKLASRLSEVLSAVPLVQAFGRERYEQERFENESSEYLEESIRNARIEAVATRAVDITTAGGTWAVVLFGALQVLNGQMTPGDILIFSSYLHSLYRPVRQLTKLSTRFSRATVSAQRISEILEVEPEIRDDPNAIEARNIEGEIVFQNVAFDYGDGKEVLRDVSFTARPGQRVALVGASGAGKSTLVSLILRLYDPQQGTVSIDGVDIKKYRRESLRREIGIVLQGSILFGATVRENIAYGKPDATMGEIVAAAEAANAHDFILELADGYDTVVGERGGTLSGGQRQRLAIARALIRDAPILILDEPMTGLDAESESKVREATKRLMAGKTCLLITHDLPAVADVDLVLLLDDGRIVERGTHAQLVAESRQYRELYELKAGGQEARGVSPRRDPA